MARSRGFGGEPDKRVLILGGGFMGVYTALQLEKLLRPEDRTEVTLVSPENFFLFTPMLPEIASSSIETTHAINPIRRMLHHTRFVEGRVEHVDTVAQRATIHLQSDHVEEFAVRSRRHGHWCSHGVFRYGRCRTPFFDRQDPWRCSLSAQLGD